MTSSARGKRVPQTEEETPPPMPSLKSPAEGGADNAGERNHHQHTDEPPSAKAIAPPATPPLPPRKVQALTTPEP